MLACANVVHGLHDTDFSRLVVKKNVEIVNWYHEKERAGVKLSNEFHLFFIAQQYNQFNSIQFIHSNSHNVNLQEYKRKRKVRKKQTKKTRKSSLHVH